jgi:hypothetical protein
MRPTKHNYTVLNQIYKLILPFLVSKRRKRSTPLIIPNYSNRHIKSPHRRKAGEGSNDEQTFRFFRAG